jgi:threonine/homoserine/homoserine lactone efflux protein
VAFIVTSSLRHGSGFGARATAGVEAGYVVHVLAAVCGLSALLAASAVAFSAVKLAGAAYLAWLAVSAWRQSRTAGERRVVNEADTAPAGGAFRQGFAVGALNPKTAVFFLAFLPQFADPARGPVATQVLVLGLAFIAIASVPDFTWALAAGRLRHRVARVRRAVVDRASAAVYALLAGVLVSTGRASS